MKIKTLPCDSTSLDEITICGIGSCGSVGTTNQNQLIPMFFFLIPVAKQKEKKRN